MEKEYWENYYKGQHLTYKPSLFAEYVLVNYLNNGDSLIEFGCGNGRDSKFFAANGINVWAIDQCEEEIKLLAKENNLDNLKYVKADFTHLDNIGYFDHVYSRFTLHSIKESDEDNTISWISDHLNNSGKLFIEVRGQKNEFFGLGDPVLGDPDAFIYEGHYRRFIKMEKLLNKLEKKKFKIIIAEEKAGFAPYKNTDQIFIRIIATK